MSKISFNTINEKTIDYILSLCDSLYLTENVKNDIKSLFKSYKKWHTKFYNIFNNALYLDYIEKELFFKINNILNDYWDSLCDELESILNGVNSNTEFIDNLSIYNINKNIKNNIIFDRNHFSEIGLLNMRLLIENMLNKYNELANQLYSFGNDLMYFKDDMIESKNNKEKELNLIKIKIDSLYYKVCPNNYSILVSDYDSLYKIFRDQTLIDSIVKINRRNLISKVRSECVNYKDKNIEILKDIEIIKKKVLNNK